MDIETIRTIFGVVSFCLITVGVIALIVIFVCQSRLNNRMRGYQPLPSDKKPKPPGDE